MTSKEKFQQNVKDYGNEIKTISSFVEAVRKTVGQYLGSRGNAGHLNMIREVYQNSLDEMEKEASPCDKIYCTYDERSREFTCTDNGRGIPFGMLIDVFSKQHTSSNYSKRAREFSSGRHGVGSKVTNACSKQFIVKSYRYDGTAREVDFADGHPSKKGEYVIKNKEKFQGTTISFVPDTDPKVMGEVTTSANAVFDMCSKLLMLTKAGKGNTLFFKRILANGKEINDTVINQDGIISFLVVSTQNPLIAPIMISDVSDRMKVDIAFTYDAEEVGGDEYVQSFANMCHTLNTSSHVEGFINTLCNYFRNYMNKIYLSNNTKVKCNSQDIKSGLRAVVSVSHIEPDFSGQAKEIFTNRDIIPYIENVMVNALDNWVKNNPNDLNKLCKFFKSVAEFRISESANKVNYIKRVKQVSSLSGLPSKFAKAEGNKDLEFIIVEGDSAKSPAIRGRDPKKQAIFPIRGKIINAFTNAKSKVLANEEVCGITAILGGGFGRNFDIKKCKYQKIIIMTDADPDGFNIRQLLVKLFISYFRPLVTEGRLYIAVPPLYSISNKSKVTFFTDKQEYINYLQKLFSKSYKVAIQKGKSKKVLSSNEVSAILYNNETYKNNLEILATTYAIDPQLLEFILRYRTMPISFFKNFLKKMNYRFLTVSSKKGRMVIDGLIGENYYTIVCNEELFNACSSIMRNIDNSCEFYYANDEKLTLYRLMTLFSKFIPKGVQRYKGLGEMGIKDLKYSTLHPDGDRKLLRLTSENISEAINEIRIAQSDLSKLIEDVDMSTYKF